MNDPKNMEEFTKLYYANSKVIGFGAETAQVFPCPFCAAPDWMTCKIVEVEKTMSDGAICHECGRGARAKFFRNGGQIQFEFFQTQGLDQPVWLTPKIRRE